MSRIGKLPVEVPKGAKIEVANGLVQIEGSKGKLSYRIPEGIEVKVDAGKVLVSKVLNDRQTSANYGSARAHIKNMLLGVSQGWKRGLELNGVGFTARLNGKKLVLNTGYSHEVVVEIPDGITCKADKTKIDLEGSDKDLVGVLAARIRKVCPPEPYLGKGIKYDEERVRRKAGKTGKK